MNIIKGDNIGTMMIRIEKLRIGAITLNRWRNCVPKDYPIVRPAVFCFSGNKSLSEKSAGEFCKIASGLLGQREAINLGCATNDVDFFGFAYGHRKDENTGWMSFDEKSEIVLDMLVPLCIDPNRNLLPLPTIKKNLSLVTFFTFCHGAIEVAQILSMFRESMIGLYHLENSEMDEIMDSFRHISYAPNTYVDMCPSVRAYTAYDFEVGLGAREEENEESIVRLDGIELDYEPPFIRSGKRCNKAMSSTIGMYSSKLLNDCKDFIDEHHIAIIDRDEKWRLKNLTTVSGVSKPSPNADAMSVLIGYALARCVADSILIYNSQECMERIPTKMLFEELSDIKAGYNEDDLKRFV